MGTAERVTAGEGLVGSFSPSRGLELAGAATDAGIVCHLDGHLDNYQQLGGDLAAAYRRWGFDLPARMRGDFVVVAWDAERREGFLARDQLGVRPVFLAQAGGRLHFASELRDLLALLPSTPGPDHDGVAHWIALSARPGTGTLFEGIERLGPGEMLRFGPGGISRNRYWEPRFDEPLALPERELAELVRDGLRDAVERRLDPEQDTAVLLSGGLDSSSIAAVAPDGVKACSGVFPEHPEADETELIDELRQALGMRGLVAEVRPGGLLASVYEYAVRWRAPLIGWGDFWTGALMAAAATQGVGTMLDGDGGDELFGPRLYALSDALRAGRPRRMVELARRLPGAGPHIGRREKARVVARIALGGATPALPAGRGLPWTEDGAPRYLNASARRGLRRSDDPDAWKRLDGPRWWADTAYGISSAIEAAGVFEHQRRRAAAAGLEARHPMLDLDFVELCLRQPPEATLDPRFNRPLLRTAMAGLVPDSVRLRPQKARFESLIASCLRGADAAVVREILTAPDAQVGAYVDRKQMESALFGTEPAPAGEEFRWMWQVWRLLTAEIWLRSLAGGNGLAERKSTLSKTRVEVRAG